MTSRALLGIGFAAALIAAAGATAFAAAPAPPPNAPPRTLTPPPNPPPPPGPGAQGPGGDPWLGYRQAYMEDYLTFLRNTLRISDAQRPLWNRFEDTLRQNMRARAAERPVPRDPRAGPLPLPDRLDQRRARLDAERAHLAATEAALRPLYAALTEEQRRIADVELAPGRLAGVGPVARTTFRERLRNRRPFGRL
jgi:hypothetical protein